MDSITSMMEDPVDPSNASGMSTAPVDASFRSETPESISLTPDQQVLYDSTFSALNEVSEFLSAHIPSVVSLEPIRVPSSKDAGTPAPPPPMMTSHPNNDSSTNSASSALFSSESTLSTLTSTVGRGHTELLRALEVLEGLEKEEQSLVYQTSLTRFLTELLTGQAYGDSRQAIASLEALGCTVPRRVCQHPFKKNDIVWVCRTCQADETCVLCHSCFSQSSHEGHDVAFYHAQAGGCCDCGDPDGTLLVNLSFGFVVSFLHTHTLSCIDCILSQLGIPKDFALVMDPTRMAAASTMVTPTPLRYRIGSFIACVVSCRPVSIGWCK
jgi:Putative zinc finger in N-recognin (UBR box)